MWLSELQVVLPDQVLPCGSLRIEGDRIAEIVEGPVRWPTVNGRRLVVLPGFIDIHGDMLEREIAPRPNANFPVDLALLELDKRLAGAGVTTAYAAISFARWGDGKDLRSEERAMGLVTQAQAMQRDLLVDLRVHARFEVTNRHAVPVLRDLIAARQVGLVSLMDHTPGQGQYRDIEMYINYIAQWRRADRAAIEEKVRERIRLAQANPPSWEVVRDVTTLACEHGIPLASHDDDTQAKVGLVAGLGVRISEFPVTLEAAQEARVRGMSVAMGAPNLLLGGSHQGNLGSKEALHHGLVDMLASDYYPAALLQAVFIIANEGTLPLHLATRLVSQGPAAALGLADRGSLCVGKLADLVLVEADGRPRVRGTIRNGLCTYWDSQMAARTCRQGSADQLALLAPSRALDD